MRFLCLILFATFSFAATLLNENIYERENRIDLMLSFDTPFTGSIVKEAASDRTVNILLTNVKIPKPFYKALHDSFVDTIAVAKSGDRQALVKIVSAKPPIRVQASKTVDGFGLRLRITHPVHAGGISTSGAMNRQQNRAASSQSLQLKSSDNLPGWRYWGVLAVLFALFLLLWFIKRRTASGKGGGWLMPKSIASVIPDGAVIRFQKPIDAHNRIVLIEYGKRQYLIVAGNSNLLLDTFNEEGTTIPFPSI